MKTKFFYVLSICLASLAFTSCHKDEPITPVVDPEVPAGPSLEVPEAVELSAKGTTTRIDLKSNTCWSFEGGESWLRVDPLSGENDKRVALTPDDNLSVESRSCVLTVCTDDGSVMKTIMVTQLGAEVKLSANVLGDLAPDKDSELSIEIKSNDAWWIEGGESWYRINQVNGSGDAVVKVTALTTNYSQDDRSSSIKIKTASMEKDLVITQKAAWIKNCNVSVNPDYVVFSDDIAFTCETSGDVLRYHYFFVTKDEENINNIGTLTSYILNASIEEGYYADPRATKEVDRIHCFDGDLMDDTDYVLYVIAVNSEGQQGGMTRLEFKTKTFDVEKEPFAMIDYDGIYMDYTYTYFYIPVIPNGVTSYYYVWTTTDPERVAGLSYSQLGYVSLNDIKNNSDKYSKNTRSWEFTVQYTTYMEFVVWSVGADGDFGGVYSSVYSAPDDVYSKSAKETLSKKWDAK